MRYRKRTTGRRLRNLFLILVTPFIGDYGSGFHVSPSRKIGNIIYSESGTLESKIENSGHGKTSLRIYAIF
jgi:hypothetical protein